MEQTFVMIRIKILVLSWYTHYMYGWGKVTSSRASVEAWFLTCTTFELALVSRINWMRFPKSKYGFSMKI